VVAVALLAPDAAAEQEVAGMSLGIDLRAEEVELLKHYATAQGRSFWSGGPGGGASLALSLHFRGPTAFEDDGRASWIDFELGVGNATHVARWRDGDTGLSTAIVETEAFARIGPRFASGRMRAVSGRPGWWGYAVALEWTPTYAYFFGSDRLQSAGHMNAAGLGLSVDFGPWNPDQAIGAARFRLSVGWLPYVNGLPTILTAGVGCAFY
jgi:hypothetical protein